MNAGSHTPGPWSLFPCESGWHVNQADGEPGFIVTMPKFYHRAAECEANALLVATAPELLAELKYMVHWHDQLAANDIGRAKALIAKATGTDAACLGDPAAMKGGEHG